MELDAVIEEILRWEWPMFHDVNGEQRAACQEDQEMFFAMRRAQFSAWSPEAAESYLGDVRAAEAAGRNLVREKYIWMMENTNPEAFARLRGELPARSDEERQLTSLLLQALLEQTERMRETHPLLALYGRPLYASQERDGGVSAETYQRGELKTYSVRTLRALLRHLQALRGQGIDLALRIQENSILYLGYSSMEEAEAAMARGDETAAPAGPADNMKGI